MTQITLLSVPLLGLPVELSKEITVQQKQQSNLCTQRFQGIQTGC